MGSIYNICLDKSKWHLTGKEAKLKENQEKIIEVCIGSCIFDYWTDSDIIIWIRENIYNNIINGKYTIHTDSKLRQSLVIVDRNGNIIKPIKKDFCY